MGYIETLREEVQKATVEDNTIVLFDRTIVLSETKRRVDFDDFEDDDDEEAPKIKVRVKVMTYAALFVANHWFLTGTQGLGTKKMKNREFIDLLAQDYISNVRVSTGLEAL